MPAMLRVGLASVLVFGAALGWSGCGERSCLRGELECRVVPPCRALPSACDSDPALAITTVTSAGIPGSGHRETLAGTGDVLLSNGQIEAVISGLGNQTFLDIDGGSLIDLRLRGQNNDALNQVTQATALLPEDEPKYDRLEIIDERPVRVAVQVSGTLFNRPDRRVYTLYELRGCERQLRIRTEVTNNGPDTQLWALSDAYYWSGRSLLPFTPTENGGYAHPSFGLTTIDGAFEDAKFLAATAPAGPPVSYATVSCTQSNLNGFHAAQVSSAGLPQTVIAPRDYAIFERVITVADGGSIAPAVNQALAIRSVLWGDHAITVAGRVIAADPTALELQLVEVMSETKRRPWTVVRPDAEGRFSARVPDVASLAIEVHQFGRKVADVPVPGGSGDRAVPDITNVPGTTMVTFRVTDGDGAPLPAEIYVTPNGPDSATAGSFFGTSPTCAPLLGNFSGGSPACNMVLIPTSGAATIAMPEGEFSVYAFRGPFFTLQQQALTTTGAPVTLDFTLRDLSLRPQGTLSADLHVHGAASFDSSIPDETRVLAFVATDTDVLIATDHDVVYDYAEVASALGVGDRLVTVAGVETTGHVPYLRVPNDPFPRVIGHYNFWPLTYRPGTPRNGGPFDELIEPGELFDRATALFATGVPIMQLNHPWALAEFGRDLGFPRAVHLNLLEPLPTTDDGSRAGMYVRTPAGAMLANDAHHTQEVMNGSRNDGLLENRAFWFYLLNQGRPKTGTANSDTHSLQDNTAGSPRNIVYAATQKNSFSIDVFNQALRDGRSFGTNGPLIDAQIRDGATVLDYGMSVHTAPSASAVLHVEVSAAPWVPVDEIRIIANGRVMQTITGAAITQPTDPFGTMTLSRYSGDIALSAVLPAGTNDAWIVVEAGRALPIHADLGNDEDHQQDGVPDTGDNNGDGIVDARDIKAGEVIGPLDVPGRPGDDDVRRHFWKVMHGGYPFAFTNPFLIDRNGNGRMDPIGVLLADGGAQ